MPRWSDLSGAWSRALRAIAEIAEGEERGLEEIRQAEASRPGRRRRSPLRSRRLSTLLAMGRLLAAILGLVFPGLFTIGWLFQAGLLAGYGVPLSLVTPDPVQQAVNAVAATILISATF